MHLERGGAGSKRMPGVAATANPDWVRAQQAAIPTEKNQRTRCHHRLRSDAQTLPVATCSATQRLSLPPSCTCGHRDPRPLALGGGCVNQWKSLPWGSPRFASGSCRFQCHQPVAPAHQESSTHHRRSACSLFPLSHSRKKIPQHPSVIRNHQSETRHKARLVSYPENRLYRV